MIQPGPAGKGRPGASSSGISIAITVSQCRVFVHCLNPGDLDGEAGK
jgi:hypothetical protein